MKPRREVPVGWGDSASVVCMACRGRGDPVVVVRPLDEGWMEERVEMGLLLGDLQVGGVNVLASEFCGAD